jgi:hypothetical protein
MKYEATLSAHMSDLGSELRDKARKRVRYHELGESQVMG